MANLLNEWDDLRADQINDLVRQVQALAESNDLAGLAELGTDWAESADTLANAMADLGHWSADQASQENGGSAVDPDRELLADAAAVVAAALALELAVSAARAALRELGTGASPQDTARAVREWLNGLSTATAEAQLGGALHGAINAGRIATFEAGPVGSLYGHEVNDANTCPPCRLVNGRFLGTTDSMGTVLMSYPAGAYGGYVYCQGGARCRGTIFGVWRQGGEG